MDLGIKGKLAIVTGVSRKGAMGDVIAKTLAAEGANVACVDVVIEGTEEIVKEIKAMGVKAMAVKADQSVYSQVKDAAAKIIKEMGPVGILVNNAAVLASPPPFPPFTQISKTEIEAWDKVIRIDLDGPFFWTREVWNSMVEQKWGRIINISSIAGLLGGWGQGNYSAAKSGIIGLAKTAALEGATKGITANCVTLGIIDAARPKRTDEAEGKLINRVAMKKRGMPNDVANAIAYLASDKAGYITGQDLHVMGGMDLFTY
jgi:3-oxoacyl-[acyl-carrier protein] reductase